MRPRHLGSLALLALLPLAAPVRGQVAPRAEPVTRIQQFWDLSAEQKSNTLPFRMEVDVTYWDPDWRLLFVQDAFGDGAYVPSNALTYPFRYGQHLLVTGQFVPPNFDVTFDHALISNKGQGEVRALSTKGILDHHPVLRNAFVSADGLVDHAFRFDAGHVRLLISAEGMSVVGWVPVHSEQDEVAQLEGCWVHVEGVYNPKASAEGRLASLELMIPDMAHVQVKGRIEDDPRFAMAISPAASLVALPAGTLVHVQGRVRDQELGRVLRLRDASGQVDILSGQTRVCPEGTLVEAVGTTTIKGTIWQLSNAIYRVVGSGAPAAAPRADPIIQMAGEVRDMQAEEAVRAHPVRVLGVVTWCAKKSPIFFLQDSSGAVCVRSPGAGDALYPGANVEVRGTTGMGPYAPQVVATSFKKVSDQMVPVATPVSYERAMSGAEESNWIEMGGYLRRVSKSDAGNLLDIVTSAGTFEADVAGTADLNPLVGGFIRVQGACTAVTSADHKLTGVRLLVPSADYVEVELEAPKSPFDLPLRPLASLGRFSSADDYGKLVRVAGNVVIALPHRMVQMIDPATGDTVLVLTDGGANLRSGDRIEAVGLLGRQQSRIVLREGVTRKVGSGPEPVPIEVSPSSGFSEDLDGRLVRLTGILLHASKRGEELHMNLDFGGQIFEAYLEGAGDMVAGLEDGSRVLVTGLLQAQSDEREKPVAYHMHLRSAADIAVLERPPWLNPRRMLTLAGSLAAVILLAMVWVFVLRRRVKAQTQQIREQLEREAKLHAELQRASKLEALGFLAGGIAHDFNNLLTAIMANLSLARLLGKSAEKEVTASLADAEKAALRAKDLTQQLLTFAKGGSPVREAVNLEGVVREVAGFALRGSKVLCDFAIAPGIWPADVDRTQIGQVVQNIVINAMQAMTNGGVLRISMANAEVSEGQGVLAKGRYVKIAFADEGVGIRADDMERIFDPYFTTKPKGSGLGLATVHSVVKRHGGHISVDSVLEKGTTFTIWLPAAAPAVQGAREPAPRRLRPRAGPRRGPGSSSWTTSPRFAG
jgi:two-component system, cell cycle sensor histidine kinase and response regulator CckA